MTRWPVTNDHGHWSTGHLVIPKITGQWPTGHQVEETRIFFQIIAVNLQKQYCTLNQKILVLNFIMPLKPKNSAFWCLKTRHNFIGSKTFHRFKEIK
jgi:hypothetical protein